ncbi:MAG TPA: TrkA family potassium uptake protein [Chloroflexota bacterium]|nr:TrkA family potassium uptake protein [Chloroflexota bacterium]
MKLVILGCGRVGSTLATMMDANGHQVTVIDRNSEAFRRLGDNFQGKTLVGEGVDEDVLRRAGIEEADAFCATTEGDNRNIMASQVVRTMFNVPKVITRIYDPIREESYRELGLETVCPTVMGANAIRDMLEK